MGKNNEKNQLIKELKAMSTVEAVDKKGLELKNRFPKATWYIKILADKLNLLRETTSQEIETPILNKDVQKNIQKNNNAVEENDMTYEEAIGIIENEKEKVKDQLMKDSGLSEANIVSYLELSFKTYYDRIESCLAI